MDDLDVFLTSQARKVSALRKKYPTRIPTFVICESKDIALKKNKFLVPKTLTLGEFMFTLRRHLKDDIDPTVGLFVMSKSKQLMHHSIVFSQISIPQSQKVKCVILFLYKENVFGK